MPNISKSAKLYQERRQPDIRKTMRGPRAYLNLEDNLVNKLPLKPPYPFPKFQIDRAAPDSTKTTVWPFGDEFAP